VTYAEALAPYAPHQQLKLVFMILRQIGDTPADAPHFNMISDAVALDWGTEAPDLETVIDAADSIWTNAARSSPDDGYDLDVGLCPDDEAIDLVPLIAELKVDGVWDTNLYAEAA
jgi:hypothetical protein